MAIRNAQPVVWRPRGVSDAVESSEAFPGAMLSLANLIPHTSTKGVWVCRPAAVKIANFVTGSGGPFSSGFGSGFQHGPIANVGFISTFHIVGDVAYGMAANQTTGNDEPFAFNLLTNTFIVVTVALGALFPQTLAPVGPWVPPQMDIIGAKLMVTHKGFAATAHFFGWFDVSNQLAPVWSSGNTTGAIVLSTVPTAVAQFNGRAYYIVNATQPAVVFSDVLNPTVVTNAGQVLTFGDIVPLTALGQLRLYNQLGGIIQALVVFKGVENMYQITGDSALGTLTLNALSTSTGTLAPNSLCATPKGLAFIAPDGIRMIDFQANVSDPIGADGDGVTLAFFNSSVPSRMAMGCNGNLLRASVQNGGVAGSPNQEYWFDMTRKTWSGPHTFAAALIQPWLNTFIVTGVGITAALWRTDPVQNATSLFIENGVAMQWSYGTVMLPDADKMSNIAIAQSTLYFGVSALPVPVTVVAVTQDDTVLDSVLLNLVTGVTIWGSFNWGQANWGGGQNALAPRILPWKKPLVAARIRFQASGTSASGMQIGALHLKYKVLRYLTNLEAIG